MRAAVVQVLGELLCGRAEDMPDVIKRESSRLPNGLSIGMVQVSAALSNPPPSTATCCRHTFAA